MWGAGKIGGLVVCLAATALLWGGCGGGGETGTGARTEGDTTADRQASPKPATVFQNLPPPDCPSHSEHFAVTLDGEPGAENVGLMLAADLDYFKDVGLDVSVGGPKTPRRSVRYIATGIDDIGVAQAPQVVLARSEGVPIVAVGSVIPQPTEALIWLPDADIEDVSDLAGKTIGLPGVPFQEELLATVLARAGLTLEDVELKYVNYKTVSALLSGRVDALFGGSPNIEGAALEEQGVQPEIATLRSLGVPPYEELVVIARSACVKKHPDVFRDFMTALDRGTEAVASRRKAAEHVIAINHGLDPEFSRAGLQAQLDATEPLLSSSGKMDLAKASRLTTWMDEQGMLETEPPVAEMFTNSYVRPKAAGS